MSTYVDKYRQFLEYELTHEGYVTRVVDILGNFEAQPIEARVLQTYNDGSSVVRDTPRSAGTGALIRITYAVPDEHVSDMLESAIEAHRISKREHKVAYLRKELAAAEAALKEEQEALEAEEVAK